MSLSDPVADMLTCIRNAKRASHPYTSVKKSKLTMAILNVLKNERFIYDFKTIDEGSQGAVRVYLETPEDMGPRRVRSIRNLMRISRPGLRVYATVDEIPSVLNGMGLCVMSTSMGVMTGKEARRRKIGGEVLLKVW